MGGGAGGQGGSVGYQSSNPVLYNWQNILPPWTIGGQQKAIPWLEQRAQTGLLPGEQRSLWGGAMEQLQEGYMGSRKDIARSLAQSGFTPSSPMYAGSMADAALGRMGSVSRAASEFAKMKIGARDTAIGQLMSALYTPPPVAVGSTSTGYSKQTAPGGK